MWSTLCCSICLWQVFTTALFAYDEYLNYRRKHKITVHEYNTVKVIMVQWVLDHRFYRRKAVLTNPRARPHWSSDAILRERSDTYLSTINGQLNFPWWWLLLYPAFLEIVTRWYAHEYPSTWQEVVWCHRPYLSPWILCSTLISKVESKGTTSNYQARSGLTGAFPLHYQLALKNFNARYGYPAYQKVE